MKIKKGTTYSQYRNGFKDVSEFRRAFGILSKEETHALIAAEHCSAGIRACMVTSWIKAKKSGK